MRTAGDLWDVEDLVRQRYFLFWFFGEDLFFKRGFGGKKNVFIGFLNEKVWEKQK